MKRAFPLLLLAGLIACGDDDPVDPGTPFEQTLNGSIESGATTIHAFTAPRGGSMEAVLDWADSEIDLDLYLTDAACTGYPPDDCDMIDASTAGTGSQETVQSAVTSGQQLKLWVDSWSLEDSDYSIDITID